MYFFFFFFNDTATTEIYTLSLHDALPIFEDQQRTVLGTDVAQSLQEAGLWHAEADVHQDGLEDDLGDLSGILLEAIFDALQIVEAVNNNIFERVLRYASAAGNGSGLVRSTVVFRLRLDADQRRVMQAVVGAFELQNLIAPGGGAGNAAGLHGDFRAAGTERHHFYRISLSDCFRTFPFLLVL